VLCRPHATARSTNTGDNENRPVRIELSDGSRKTMSCRADGLRSRLWIAKVTSVWCGTAKGVAAIATYWKSACKWTVLSTTLAPYRHDPARRSNLSK
jgi:hypothetical protein